MRFISFEIHRSVNNAMLKTQIHTKKHEPTTVENVDVENHHIRVVKTH